jgi:hypothetical protein
MKPSKSYLNENEAAEFLGVSAATLRGLIRSHVATEDTDLSKVGMTQFQPADLLLLRFLLGKSRGETPAAAEGAQSETNRLEPEPVPAFPGNVVPATSVAD